MVTDLYRPFQGVGTTQGHQNLTNRVIITYHKLFLGTLLGQWRGKNVKKGDVNKKPDRLVTYRVLLKKLVPGARIELAQRQAPRDFKSLASTSSAIRAMRAILSLPE